MTLGAVSKEASVVQCRVLPNPNSDKFNQIKQLVYHKLRIFNEIFNCLGAGTIRRPLEQEYYYVVATRRLCKHYYVMVRLTEAERKEFSRKSEVHLSYIEEQNCLLCQTLFGRLFNNQIDVNQMTESLFQDLDQEVEEFKSIPKGFSGTLESLVSVFQSPDRLGQVIKEGKLRTYNNLRLIKNSIKDLKLTDNIYPEYLFISKVLPNINYECQLQRSLIDGEEKKFALTFIAISLDNPERSSMKLNFELIMNSPNIILDKFTSKVENIHMKSAAYTCYRLMAELLLSLGIKSYSVLARKGVLPEESDYGFGGFVSEVFIDEENRMYELWKLTHANALSFLGMHQKWFVHEKTMKPLEIL